MEKSSLLMLQDIDVTVSTDEKPLTILKKISLSFLKGQSAAIVGPSGSGKTTLMMVCGGLQRPTGGRMIFNDKELPSGNEEALSLWRQENVGIVFQNFHLLPTNSALENVMLPLELAGAVNARQQAEDLLKAVGLSHRLHHLPGQLSGGEQQRVALARAMSRRPSILLADEPTGNLDQATGQKVMELLFEQAKKFNTTLVLITHDERIAARCDRIISLRDGEIVSDISA